MITCRHLPGFQSLAVHYQDLVETIRKFIASFAEKQQYVCVPSSVKIFM
jgi:hypothetical protein